MSHTNPFNITTAVDYSDEEINRYWVDFISNEKNLVQLMKTDSPMPMLILGGKGSGKTHIMRYFSFNSKKIRYKNNFVSNFQDDKYLGIYLRCGGLNSSRFKGNSFTSEQWKALFGYYIELWFSQLLLQITTEIFQLVEDQGIDEEKISNEIIESLFDKKTADKPKSLEDLRSIIQGLQKKLDFEINNCSITGKSQLDIEILVTPGKLTFGIPRILREKVPIFKDFQFIYLIDEFENLLTDQQRYVNTLLREREAPVTFRVGARWYGIKTYKTYSGDEDIKEGSEYEKYVIDKIFRESDEFYEKFITEICLKRLRESGYLQFEEPSNFSVFYENYNLENFLSQLSLKSEKVGHFVSLVSKLRKIKGLDIPSIVSNLKFPNDLIIERTNVFLFYREWKRLRGAELLQASDRIKQEANAFYNNSQVDTRHFKVLDKFKGDLVDQLLKESQEKIPYTGFNKLIKMSAGIPRLLLITLKHIHRWSVFQGQNPFVKDQLNVSAQIKGITEASNWFLEDARIPGPDGRKVSDVIGRLGQYLQELRFADCPPECSICSFSINLTDATEEVRLVLEYLEQYSYIIKVSERTEKNSVRKFDTYQINGLIATKWDLSLYRRGIIQFTSEEVSAIFVDSVEDFEKFRKSRLLKYNAPFSSIDSSPTLFDNQ